MYLQSFQQSEVLKGSSLDNSDLVVLQMTIAMDIETQRKQQQLYSLSQLNKSTIQKQTQQKYYVGKTVMPREK